MPPLTEEKPKWTPGPWRFDDSDPDFLVVVSDGVDVIDPDDNTARSMPVVDLTHGGYRFEDHGYSLEANARLIAAAPDLCEMAKLFESCIEYEIRKSEKDGDDEGAKLKSMTLARVRAALAKAGV